MKVRRNWSRAVVPGFAILIGLAGPGRGSGADWLSDSAFPGSPTELWWRDGFPGLIEGAPWHQCLRTGEFGMVFDTMQLSIPHFGPLRPEEDLFQLPPAEFSLRLVVDGRRYRAVAGGPWTRHGGPRLVESGRYFQRADVTGLEFRAEDGSLLNVDARIEFSAWQERLNWVLTARPGKAPFEAGEESFGRRGGGFGLTGINHLELAPGEVPDSPQFTQAFWAFVPGDYQATEVSPWLFCRDRNELADGNVGVVIGSRAVPQARINIGGGPENAHVVPGSRPLRIGSWNHFVLSYDGDFFRFYVNDRLEGEKRIGIPRSPSPAPLAFGRRQDNSGTGYYFRGVIDEIRFSDRAMSPAAVRELPEEELIASRSFRSDGISSRARPRETWHSASASVSFVQGDRRWKGTGEWAPGEAELTASVALNPSSAGTPPSVSPIQVRARMVHGNEERPVSFDSSIGWHRINLDGVVPVAPNGESETGSNDGMERVWIDLENPSGKPGVASMVFEKTARGMRQRIGSPITGVSAILRDERGFPVGIPVQLSKNWHHDPLAGEYSGQWFHGITRIPLSPGAKLRLELSIVYGHWGGVPAASHAQLSLIGWGSNQRWDQSALGAWGESICFEPDQIQGKATVTDVRPLMVTPMNGEGQWSWTHNVGGADFFRLFDPAGNRQFHRGMRTRYHRQGPCLTEVTYSGRIGEGISHAMTVSLGRTDDLVRGTYRIRLEVTRAMEFSRFVLFQVGADTYNMSRDRLLAIGDGSGLTGEWEASVEGSGNVGAPRQVDGGSGWISLHDGKSPKPDTRGAWASRGIVVRSWQARLGGEAASAFVVEHRPDSARSAGSTIDFVPPPGVSSLRPGDFVEAVIEHLVIPQSSEDYYGPNRELRSALERQGNTWRMVEREATGNARMVTMQRGRLIHRFPDVRVATEDDAARFRVERGLGYVPFTFTGLSRPDRFALLVDGVVVDQSRHGNDFWQAEFDPDTASWSLTFTIPIAPGERSVELRTVK